MNRYLLLFFLFFAMSTVHVVGGASCAKSLLGKTNCRHCGKGTRCVSCDFCIGYCVNMHTMGKRDTQDKEDDLVEASYKIPILEMLDDMDALFKEGDISELYLVHLYKELSVVTREDCESCNNSPELNDLSIFTNETYLELESLVGTQDFKSTANNKTAKSKTLVQQLPESLKIEVEPTSNIIESINSMKGISLLTFGFT